MSYTVKYKQGLFWKVLRNVIADGFIEQLPIRFFILQDGRRIEIESKGVTFIFSKERNEKV